MAETTLNRVEGIWARYLNVLLGAWLVISDFVWRHTTQANASTWITGVLVVAFALWALWVPNMRWWNTLLGAWAIVAAFIWPHVSGATPWNNIVVGVLILLVSLVPSAPLPDRKTFGPPPA